jgi:hypothetical protein
MRNIFQLTKREQRVVIVIVTTLVAFAFAKHYWQNKPQPPPIKSISTPVASPSVHSPTDQSDDSRD